jgi:hypothetical protein
MSKLWIPPSVSDEYRDSTRQFNAELSEMLHFTNAVCAQWNPELEKIDPLLKLAKAKENVVSPVVRAGFYHLVRMNTDCPWTAEPLAHPVDGSFVEPTIAMLDMLRANDLQNARVTMDRKLAEERDRREKQSAKDREREDRQQEIVEKWLAVSRAQVSMSSDQPWSQNVAGRRRSPRRAA